MWSGLALSVGRELDEWVDEMVGEFWQLENVCSTLQLLPVDSVTLWSAVRRHTGRYSVLRPKIRTAGTSPAKW